MAEVSLRVDGMSCEGCSKRLQTSLNALEGVQQAQVTLKPGQAVVQYDETQVTVQALKESIEESGFDVLN
ncbi:heavy-metal-associated domain-containing protein [Neokomagataea anthophila]|uniref:Heavy-metal-associated domain-containing protein n=1 Tax=Neokomagataea anthophila TaxID=2826925 RepID=A0ABS5E4R6_9PROT|nr:heavy-metal-associated domain-containing protein [Neokomagataea anthophila]MBR0558896.1 heavy-metal-associated domain-containing protein [Neokomagataea anthophila]